MTLGGGTRGRRRIGGEPVRHVAAVLAGPIVASLLTGAIVGMLVWRTAAIGLALSLVVHGLAAAVRLGRAEWERRSPPASAYGRAVLRFAAAFVLVVLATS